MWAAHEGDFITFTNNRNSILDVVRYSHEACPQRTHFRLLSKLLHMSFESWFLRACFVWCDEPRFFLKRQHGYRSSITFVRDKTRNDHPHVLTAAIGKQTSRRRQRSFSGAAAEQANPKAHRDHTCAQRISCQWMATSISQFSAFLLIGGIGRSADFEDGRIFLRATPRWRLPVVSFRRCQALRYYRFFASFVRIQRCRC